MLKNIPAIIQHRHSTKLFSIVLGYCLWACIAQHQTITKTIQMPVLFYDIENQNITTAETVAVKIQGTRNNIYHFNTETAAVHLNASNLQQGTQELPLDKENLFLPDTIKLVDLVPSHITIHVNPIEKT